MTLIEKRVWEFAESVATQTDAVRRGDAKAGNKHAKRYIRAFEALRALGDEGQDALVPLVFEARDDVRVMAAAFLIRASTGCSKQRIRAMSSTGDVERAIGLICSYSELAHFMGPRDESTVAAAETMLGMRFCESYRTFVLRLGAGSFGSFEVYGVMDNEPGAGVPDAVALTLEDRLRYGLPDNLLIIGSTGYGPDYVLDTSRRGTDGDGPVLIWSPGDTDLEEDARSFAEYFLRNVQRRIEWHLEDEDD